MLAQEKEELYTCDEIMTGIDDETLLEVQSDARVIWNLSAEKTTIYVVEVKNQKLRQKIYYVAKPLMKKIRRSLRKNACEEITIIPYRNYSKALLVDDQYLKKYSKKRKGAK